MIKATFFSYNDNYYSFIIEGHANHGFSGNDIICAAVSSAVDMTINAIKNIIKEDCFLNINPSKAEVYLKMKNKTSEKASLFIQSLYDHLLNISEAYPDNVKVKNKLGKE